MWGGAEYLETADREANKIHHLPPGGGRFSGVWSDTLTFLEVDVWAILRTEQPLLRLPGNLGTGTGEVLTARTFTVPEVTATLEVGITEDLNTSDLKTSKVNTW